MLPKEHSVLTGRQMLQAENVCIIIVNELKHSKTILENNVEIGPQPVTSKLSQYFSGSK